ncbi:hypothetical protein [Pseudophaeobacter flagellatus]|uniref:hypothetical protein n=1 Tax=Pseudophaeobacter flagellatus TaxID=2899119 RepID=UPI001E41A67B|nr:hypothetical protein [Pseudophaeobacter flagellatus]MCD9148876.1 hypothetical protein [Pseudophaeobacter flagellatus]
MRAIIFTLGFGAAATLSACGDTTGEQVIFGAGAGAAGSALLHGNLVTGAAVGAAANLIYCKENPRKC